MCYLLQKQTKKTTQDLSRLKGWVQDGEKPLSSHCAEEGEAGSKAAVSTPGSCLTPEAWGDCIHHHLHCLCDCGQTT